MAEETLVRIAGLCEIRRPSSYAEVINRHLPLLIATAPFLLAARIIPRGTQIVPGCIFKTLTGVPCMFCGYTRAFQAIARMNLLPALRDNPAAVVLFLFMMAVALWNLAGLLARRLILPGRWLRVGNGRLVAWGTLLFFMLNWVYRILMISTCGI